MRVIRPERGNFSRGFSRWIRPVMKSYLLACCDCGLVHELQFHTVKVTRRNRDGSWGGQLLPRHNYRVMFRARRARNYTIKQRKHRAQHLG